MSIFNGLTCGSSGLAVTGAINLDPGASTVPGVRPTPFTWGELQSDKLQLLRQLIEAHLRQAHELANVERAGDLLSYKVRLHVVLVPEEGHALKALRP